jgi:hypothetical protein
LAKEAIERMWLRVWDKTREKNGENEAIYELHTSIEENFSTMRFLERVIEQLLNNIEYGRFIVLLQSDLEKKRR